MSVIAQNITANEGWMTKMCGALRCYLPDSHELVLVRVY